MIFLITRLLHSNKEIGKKFKADNTVCRVDWNIVQPIKFFVTNVLKSKCYKEKDKEDGMQVIITTFMGNLSKNINKKECDSIGMMNCSFYSRLKREEAPPPSSNKEVRNQYQRKKQNLVSKHVMQMQIKCYLYFLIMMKHHILSVNQSIFWM